MDAEDVGALAHGQGAAATVPHSRSPAGSRSSQDPASTAPMKSLRESET